MTDGKDGNLMKYRDVNAMMHRILTHMLSKPQSKTELMYEARLNHQQIDRYLDFFNSKKLIEIKEGKTGRNQTRPLYYLTDKGKAVLDAINRLRPLLS